jgi:hypothetical protein
MPSGVQLWDLRHHAITELAEGNASDSVIRSIAGHVSEKMPEHYSHVRMDAKRAALDAISALKSGHGQEPHGTIHDTTAKTAVDLHPQVVEEIGGRHRARTGDLRVANAALSQLS